MRTARGQQRAEQWQDGSFRPAAVRRGVPPMDSTAMQQVRQEMQRLLCLGNQPWGGGNAQQWTAAQWADWEKWVSPVLVVDWVGDGLPEASFEPDDEDGDEGVFMQLDMGEEDLLHQLNVPDERRRDIRDLLRGAD